jgi:hypothetical protein
MNQTGVGCGLLELCDDVEQTLKEFGEFVSVAHLASAGLTMKQQATEGVESRMSAAFGGTDVGFTAVVFMFGGFEMVLDLSGMVEQFLAERTLEWTGMIGGDLPDALWEDQVLPHEPLLEVAMMAEVFVDVFQLDARWTGARFEVSYKRRGAHEVLPARCVRTPDGFRLMKRGSEMLLLIAVNKKEKKKGTVELFFIKVRLQPRRKETADHDQVVGLGEQCLTWATVDIGVSLQTMFLEPLHIGAPHLTPGALRMIVLVVGGNVVNIGLTPSAAHVSLRMIKMSLQGHC